MLQSFRFVKPILTMKTQGDVNSFLFGEALGVRELGTLEHGGTWRITNVDPAHSFLSIDEVHGCGLARAYRDRVGTIQRRGLDVLRVGDEEVWRTVHRVWNSRTCDWIKHDHVPRVHLASSH